MKNLMLGTAAAALIAMPALAENHASAFLETTAEDSVRASNFIGMRVYASEIDMLPAATDGVQDGWDDIGEINDIVLTRSGEIDAVLVDIGGFLGIGERQVAIDMAALSFVADDATMDAPQDYFLVLNAPRTLLEEAPEYESALVMTAADTDAQASLASDPDTATQEALGLDEEVAANDEGMATDAPVLVDVVTLSAEELTGVRVYDANNEDIGEVSDVVLATTGAIESVIIDVGGFLGMGEKPVALPVADLNIQREDGGDLMVSVAHSMAALEAMPDYQY